MKVLEKLRELGWVLPPAPMALASYIPAKKSRNWVFVSGQLPIVEGTLPIRGKLGRNVSLEEGKRLAHIAVLNGLASASTVLPDLDAIGAVVRLGVYVACTEEFEEQHLVANGASETLEKLWGDQGKHARFAVGVPSLPLGSPVEVEFVLEIL